MAPGIDQVEARRRCVIGEFQACNLHAAPPERGEAKVSRDLAAHYERLIAESRIIHDLKVVYIKTGSGQNAVFYLPNLYFASEGRAESPQKVFS